MMRDKTVLITGASSGTGLAMATALARMGASVLMVSREPERARRARDEVAEAATGPAPTLFLADLSAQAEVRRLAADVRASTTRLDVLINNAGAAFRRRQVSADGIERTLATNHLAPFLLTHLFMDLLRAAPAGRVVNVTASLHSQELDFGNLQLERGYGTFRAYKLSKACNISFTYELARRLRGTAMTSNCYCPGPTRSGFGAKVGGFMGWLQETLGLVGFLHSAEVGGRTGVYLASSPNAAEVTGGYFLHNGKPAKSSPITYDQTAAARLWDVSEELCGLGRKPLAAGAHRVQVAS